MAIPTSPLPTTYFNPDLSNNSNPSQEEPNPIPQKESQIVQPDRQRPHRKPSQTNHSTQTSGTSGTFPAIATGTVYPGTTVGESGTEPAYSQGSVGNPGKSQDAGRRNSYNPPNHQGKGPRGKPSNSEEHRQPNGQSPYTTPGADKPRQDSTPSTQPIPGYPSTAGPIVPPVIGQDPMGMVLVPMFLPDGQMTYGIVLNNQIYPGQMMYGGMGVSGEWE